MTAVNILEDKDKLINTSFRYEISKEDILNDMKRMHGAFESTSTPKVTSPKPASTCIKSPVKYADKPSALRENFLTPVTKVVKVSCETKNPLKRLKSNPEAASTNVELDGSFLENLDTVFIADYECNLGEPEPSLV